MMCLADYTTYTVTFNVVTLGFYIKICIVYIINNKLFHFILQNKNFEY